MPSDIATSSTEELRLKNHLAQMKQRYDMESRDLEQQHDHETQRMIDTGTQQLDQLRRDYDVRISQEAEALEQHLHDVHLRNEERVRAEKHLGEEELARVKLQNHQKYEEYRKNGEAQLEALRKELQASADTLHTQERKREIAERELADAQQG